MPLPVRSLTRYLEQVSPGQLALAAVAVALLARLLLSDWLAAGGYAVAAILFGWAARARPSATATSISRAGALAGYALVVAVVASLIVKTAQPASSFPVWWLVLLGWGTAVAAYAVAWADPGPLLQRARCLARDHRAEFLVAAALVVLALVPRVIALDRLPRTFGGDDGLAALVARAVLQGKITSPFGISTIALGQHPSLFFFPQAGLMRIFGDDVAGSRMIAALLGTATVLGVYLLGRQWFGPTVALVAAAMLATLPYHLFWSRNPLNNIADGLSVVVVLLLATRAFASQRRWHFALTGLALGLSQYAYVSARLLYGIVFILLLREAIARRQWLGRNLSNLAVLVGGWAVAYLPQAVYYVDHPKDFTSRFSQVSVLQPDASGAIDLAAAASLLADQFRRTFLIFHSVPLRSFYEPDRPLLDPLAGVFFVFGLAVAVMSFRRRAWFALVATLLLYLVGAAITENAPSSGRLVAVGPLAALLVAAGLVRLVEIGDFPRKWAERTAIVALTAYITWQGAQFYFFQYANNSNYDFPNGEAATVLAHDMQAYPPGTRFLFLAQPRMSCTSHATVRFISPDRVCLDVPPPGTSAAAPALQPGDVVVALPERVPEAERMLAAAGGQGKWNRTPRLDSRDHELLQEFTPVP